jgi:hypothetical protein
LHIYAIWFKMGLWKFFDYVTDENENLLQDWYVAQDPEVQAQFDATLLILGATEDWEAKDVEEFKPLINKHKGLGEVRFHISALALGAKRPHRRRFRPVGIWPAAQAREFVLILGCEKSGKTFIPHDAFGVALQHKARLEAGKGKTYERI